MKFKSKTELIEHMNQLVRDGYITKQWIVEPDDHGMVSGRVMYAINFEAIKNE